MSTKFDLLKEFYEVDNQIKKIKGQPLFEIDRLIRNIEKEAGKFTKEELETKLANRKKDLEQIRKAEEAKKKTEEYFNSSVGKTFKEMTEGEIKAKREEIRDYRKAVIANIEEFIHTTLGQNWRVMALDQGMLRIGVIDKEKSTPDKTEYHFGQEAEIRYNKARYGETEDNFEISVGACSSFNPENQEPGSLANFYKGIGRLLDSQLLVKMLKKILKESLEESEVLLKQLTQLRERLIDPLGLNKK